MDYSSDDCYEEFTPGQIERMFWIWSLYRDNSENCAPGHRMFEVEVQADQAPRQLSWKLRSTDGAFEWDSRQSNNGIVFNYETNVPSTLDICLDESKQYVFTMFDSNGNGISPPGYYAIRYDGRELKRNSRFGSEERTEFLGSPSSSSGPPPAPSPMTLKFEITYDDYWEETSWSFTQNGQVLAKRDAGLLAFIGSETDEMEVQQGEVEFEIEDAFGDGICCTYGAGGYNIYLTKPNGQQKLLASGNGRFGFGEIEVLNTSASRKVKKPHQHHTMEHN